MFRTLVFPSVREDDDNKVAIEYANGTEQKPPKADDQNVKKSVMTQERKKIPSAGTSKEDEIERQKAFIAKEIARIEREEAEMEEKRAREAAAAAAKKEAESFTVTNDHCDPSDDDGDIFFDSSEQQHPPSPEVTRLMPRPSSPTDTLPTASITITSSTASSPRAMSPSAGKPQVTAATSSDCNILVSNNAPQLAAAAPSIDQMHKMSSRDPDWPSRTIHDAKAKYGTFPQRDVCGYGHSPPHPKWPNDAKLALNIVLHFQEGAEMSCPLHTTTAVHNNNNQQSSMQFQRHLNKESQFDYGARAGFWRLHRLLTSKDVPCTVFAAGMALKRNLQVCKAMKDVSNWEIASQGYTWQDEDNHDSTQKEEEKDLFLKEMEQIVQTVAIHEELLGRRPVGYYRGEHLSLLTRSTLCQAGGFLYDSDSFADDLPYWDFVPKQSSKTTNLETQPHLIIPYTKTETDLIMVTPGSGITTGIQFFEYLKEQFDALLEEGKEGRPKLMSVGLHCRISGHAGRCASGIGRFLDYVKTHKELVWMTTREEIAKHWYDTHYPIGGGGGYAIPV